MAKRKKPEFDSVLIDRRKLFELEDEELLKVIRDDFTESDNYFASDFGAFRRFDSIYDMQHPEGSLPARKEHGGVIIDPRARANMFYPLGRAIVDTAVSTVIDNIFPSIDFFDIMPAETWQYPQHAETWKSFIQYEVSPERMNLRARFFDWLLYAFKYRWASARIDFRSSGNLVLKRIELAKQAVQETLSENQDEIIAKVSEQLSSEVDKMLKGPKVEAVWDPQAVRRPDMYVANPYITRPDPNGRDFDEGCRYHHDEFGTNWTDIIAQAKSKENPDGLYDATAVEKMQGNARKYISQNQALEQGSPKSKFSPDKPYNRDIVRLRRYSTINLEVITDVEYKVVLRRRKTDGWKWSKMTYWPRQNSWASYSLLELVEALNIDYNSIKNSRRDNVNFALDCITIINKSLRANTDKPFVRIPGEIYECNGDPDKAIKFDRPPDMTAASENEAYDDERWAEKITSFGENQAGVYRSGGRRSATESSIVDSRSTTRMYPINMMIEQNNLSWAMKQMIAERVTHQSEDEPFNFKGNAAPFSGVLSMELISRYGVGMKVIPFGSQAEIDKWRDLLGKRDLAMVIAQTPMARFMNWAEYLRVLLIAQKIHNPDGLIKSGPNALTSIPPEIEHVYMSQGNILAPSDADDVEDHLMQHEEFMTSPDFMTLDEDVQRIFKAHYAQTQRQQQEMQATTPQANTPNLNNMVAQSQTQGQAIAGSAPMAVSGPGSMNAGQV